MVVGSRIGSVQRQVCHRFWLLTLANNESHLVTCQQLLKRLTLPDFMTAQVLHTGVTEDQVQAYFAQGGFPKQGRSLEEKIDEALHFLAEEIPKSGIVGTGAAIVYQDEVVLAKGYGHLRWNDSEQVTETSLFQIGSVSKTMIAVAIGLLVEDGKVQWRDSVKKHLPWLVLHDKYAEEHVTIGDMLSMNSGFGAVSDIADMFGAFVSEREYVEALQFLEPDHSLREKPAYANVNFVILGQLIESVSGQTWYEFLKQCVWEPLGMKNTFASTLLIPSEGQAITAGHFVYEGEVLGPFDITKDRETFLKVGMGQELNAAGSIVSCVKDMATFIRLLLNKGSVGDVKLLESTSTIAEMITGKVTATSTVAQVTKMGLRYDPDGSTLAAGYGIDLIANAYGICANGETGCNFHGNSQVPDPHASFYLDHYRTYVMGIFLDVPKGILDFEYQKLRAADQLPSPFPGAPALSLRFWKDLPTKELNEEQIDILVGNYSTTTSGQFFPQLVIDRADGDSQLTLTLALSSGPLYYLGEVEGMPSMKLFLAKFALGPAVLPASVSSSGQFVFNVGVSYRKQE